MKRKLFLATLVALVAIGLLGSAALATEPILRQRGLGKVTEVDLDGGTLTVENQRGTFVVHTDDETVFRIRGVENPSLADIKVGDTVAGQVLKPDPETLLAKMIAVVPPKDERIRGLGKVTEVDLDGGTLTVENQRGTFVVHTDDETVFRVRGVEYPSLADIKVGDTVAGQVLKPDPETLLAKMIAVVPPKDDRVRGLGKVTEVGLDGGTLTVENQRGTFVVHTDDETVFRIRGVEYPSLADIKVGDIVAGQVLKPDPETLLAKMIAVVPPRN